MPATSPDILWGDAGSLGGALEKFPIVPPTGRQIDLSFWKPELAKFFS